MLLAYQVVVAVAAYQLTSALLSQLPLNEVRSCICPLYQLCRTCQRRLSTSPPTQIITTVLRGAKRLETFSGCEIAQSVRLMGSGVPVQACERIPLC